MNVKNYLENVEISYVTIAMFFIGLGILAFPSFVPMPSEHMTAILATGFIMLISSFTVMLVSLMPSVFLRKKERI